ncbi:MAG: hypothetical protein ISS23_03050 [Nanoarchaeota archaeon]|nr:hypothetical protein [Nanoarchaeota archaeon]
MKNKIQKMLLFGLVFILSSFFVSAYFNSPLNNQYVSGVIRVEFTIENDTGIKEYQLFVDEKAVDVDCTSKGDKYFRCVHFFDTRDKDGEHVIKTWYVNKNGEEISENITIIANNEKITVSLDSPKGGEVFNKNLLLKATASSNADFISFEHSRDKINWKEIGVSDSKGAEIEWDLRYAENGDYVLRAVAFNNLGAKANSNLVNVKVEKPTKEPFKYKYLIIGGIALIIIILIFVIIKRRRKPI